MLKSVLQSRAAQFVIGGLVALWMTLVKYTTRWDIQRADIAAPIIGNGQGFIALTWHSRFLMLTSAWRGDFQPPHVLISRSRDGDIVARTSKFLGLDVIRGSAKKAGTAKSKGGAEAGRGVLHALEQGGCIVVTPDGPRGPRQRLGIGPLRLARLSGAPLLPCTFAIKNRKQFDSWDRFVLPLPFGRGMIIWGTPVSIAADVDDAELETIRLRIETEMNTFLAQADQAMGHDPVDPA